MQGKLDIPDAVVSPFFVLSSAIALGLVNFSLAGFDFASTALEFSGSGFTTTISYATIVSIIALGTAYATNRRDFSRMGALELWTVIATVALVITPPLRSRARAPRALPYFFRVPERTGGHRYDDPRGAV